MEQVIYLGLDDEMITVLDRIEQATSRRVVLVFPDRARALQSTVHLKLLQRRAGQLNLKLGLVITDKQGISVARSLNFRVAPSLDELHNLMPGDGGAEEQSPDQLLEQAFAKADQIAAQRTAAWPEPATEIPGEVNEDNLLQQLLDPPEEAQTTQAKPHKRGAQELSAGGRTATTIPTASVATPDAPEIETITPEITTDVTAEQPTVAEAITPEVTAPVAAVAQPEPVKEEADLATTITKKLKRPAKTEAAQAQPAPQTMLADEATATKAEEILTAALTPAPPKTLVVQPRASLTGAAKKRPASRPGAKKSMPVMQIPLVRALSVLVALVVVAVGAYGAIYVMPTATVTVQAATTTFPDTIHITADVTAAQVDPANGIIPTHILSQTVSAQLAATTTGQKHIGNTFAHGQVVISNFNLADVTVPSGTTMTASKSGQQFVTTDSIDVPKGRILSDTTLQAGNATIGVQAVVSGTIGNVAADTIDTIAPIASLNGLRTHNPAAMSGGTDLTIHIVAQSDLDNLQTQLTQKLTQQLQDAINTAQQGSVKLQALPTKSGLTSTASVGDATTVVTSALTFIGSVVVAQMADMRPVIDKHYTDDAKATYPTYSLVNQWSLSGQPTVLTTTTGATQFPLNVNVSGLLQAKVDQQMLRQHVTGHSTTELNDYLTGLQTNKSIASAQINLQPAWLENILPMELRRFSILPGNSHIVVVAKPVAQ